MKKITSILITLVCTAILFSSCGNKAQKVGDVRDVFPQEMSGDVKLPEDTKNLIGDYDASVFDADVNIYYNVSDYSEEYEKTVAEKFGFSQNDKVNLANSNSNRYKNDNGDLSIEKDSGDFSLNLNNREKNDITDIEYFNALGETKLKEFGVLPEKYCLSGYVMKGGKTDIDDEEGEIAAYGPRFAQKIDGREVVGAGSTLICFNSDGEILSIDSYWHNPIYAAKAKTLSFEEAYARIGGEYSYLATELGSPDTPLTKVEFDTVNAVYYKNPEYDYYVPMFRFEGTAWSGDRSDVIWAYVIAIPDLTDDMIQK